MNAAEATPDQIIAGIREAIKAHDMPAVASLLRVLAVKDPLSAELLVSWIDALAKSSA